MNIENYVCTLDQAKKLDKLLGTRESIFYWLNISAVCGIVFPSVSRDLEQRHFRLGNAYTSQELGEMISDFFNHESVWINNFIDHKIETYCPSIFEKAEWMESRFPEAQARAEFLIYLLENKNGQ